MEDKMVDRLLKPQRKELVDKLLNEMVDLLLIKWRINDG
jgi:hypothetical protein